ncbi:hypothetical protein KUL156_38330 [Alteromonas sp. KUL156]|nr:hypothetical protein KUL118_59250 [Tenacibaculum sp. KUL118]GFD97190.1 hypothetical protein KUL154_59230 [Alteromonas sp. KUL154]GFE01241.1 hypothetical protein KUL156_38330 [Alteromonas sp. KUL156]
MGLFSVLKFNSIDLLLTAKYICVSGKKFIKKVIELGLNYLVMSLGFVFSALTKYVEKYWKSI